MQSEGHEDRPAARKAGDTLGGAARAETPALALITVRERRTLGSDVEPEVECRIDCPRASRSTEFVGCQRCGFGQIFFLDAATRRTRFYCSHAPLPPPQARLCTIDVNTSVRAIIGDRCTCVREDVSIDAITTLFLEEGVTAVPVVDVDGRPVGMITKTDILRGVRDRDSEPHSPLPRELRRTFHVDSSANVCAADVMMPLVFAILESTTLAQAIPLMTYENVHHAPVVAIGGKLIGVLTSMDVLRFFNAVLSAP